MVIETVITIVVVIGAAIVPIALCFVAADARRRPHSTLTGTVVAKQCFPEHTAIFVPPVPAPSVAIRWVVPERYYVTVDIGGWCRRTVEVNAETYTAVREGAAVTIAYVSGRLSRYRYVRGIVS